MGAKGSAVSAIASQFVSAGGAMALTLLTAAVLGPAGRGEIAYFLLFSTLFAYVLALGLPGSAIRDTAIDPTRARAVVGATVWHSLLLAALFAVLLLTPVSERVLRPLDQISHSIAAASCLLGAATITLSWAEYGRGHVAFSNLAKAAVPAGTAGVLGLLLVVDQTVDEATVARSYVLFQALVVLVLASRLSARSLPDFGIAYVLSALVTGLPYFVTVMSQLAMQRVDQAVIAVAARTNAELGHYSLAASASEIVTYAPTALALIAFRQAAQERTAGRATLLRQGLYFGLPAAALVAATGAIAIPALLPAFQPSVPLLLILAPGAVALAVMRLLSNAMAGLGVLRRANVITILQATGMIGAYLIFIPSYGATAAAVISTLGYSLGAIGLYLCFPKAHVMHGSPEDKAGSPA